MEYLFFVMLLLAIFAVSAARWIERSKIGRGFAAIRDDEVAAECAGVPTLRLKLIATTVSGFLMGVAGAPFVLYVGFVEPASAFNLVYAVNSIAMPMIGGATTWLGPVIGALLLGLRPADRDGDDIVRAQPADRGRAARVLRDRGARGYRRTGPQMAGGGQ